METKIDDAMFPKLILSFVLQYLYFVKYEKYVLNLKYEQRLGGLEKPEFPEIFRNLVDHIESSE